MNGSEINMTSLPVHRGAYHQAPNLHRRRKSPYFPSHTHLLPPVPYTNTPSPDQRQRPQKTHPQSPRCPHHVRCQGQVRDRETPRRAEFLKNGNRPSILLPLSLPLAVNSISSHTFSLSCSRSRSFSLFYLHLHQKGKTFSGWDVKKFGILVGFLFGSRRLFYRIVLLCCFRWVEGGEIKYGRKESHDFVHYIGTCGCHTMFECEEAFVLHWMACWTY